MLSADATEQQAERLRAAGAAAYVTKPIDVTELLGVLVGQLAEPDPGASRSDRG